MMTVDRVFRLEEEVKNLQAAQKKHEEEMETLIRGFREELHKRLDMQNTRIARLEGHKTFSTAARMEIR